MSKNPHTMFTNRLAEGSPMFSSQVAPGSLPDVCASYQRSQGGSLGALAAAKGSRQLTWGLCQLPKASGILPDAFGSCQRLQGCSLGPLAADKASEAP